MSNAHKILIHWANQQENWVRAVVKEVLETRQPASATILELAYETCIAEKQLSSGAAVTTPSLTDGDGSDEQTETLLLTRIAEVENVNRLAPKQEIGFNPRMTVVFGENATGKSGYVRILKRVAKVRSAEKILPDIQSSSARELTPSALIEYSIQNSPQKLKWNNESGVAPLNRISIFDARAISFHLDEDLTYLYTPRDLALFQYVHHGIQEIRDKLETHRKEIQPTGNPYRQQFRPGSSVYANIEPLGASTDVAELVKLAEINPAEEANIGSLRETVEALQSQFISSRLELATSDQELFDAISGFLQKLIDFNWYDYNAAVQRVQMASDKVRAATESAFASENIPGLMGDTWKQFVESGEAYLHDIGKDGYPTLDDACIYCHQSLDSHAISLIQKYRDFCNNNFKRDLAEAQRNLQRQSARLNFDTASLEDRINKKINAFPPNSAPEVLTKCSALLIRVRPLIDSVQSEKVVDLPVENTELQGVIDGIASLSANNIQNIETLKKQGEERERLRSEAAAKLRELQDRVLLRDLLPQIKKYVQNAKWAYRGEKILRESFPPLLRSLTTVAKTASEDLLNRDFERCFVEECQALKAPTVRLEFPGREGEPARRKILSSDYRLSEILSEGEQKVVALADFLAEAAIRTGIAPLVFDDPVNSLDYRRVEYIAQRLFSLNQKYQIIVFTHNIWFTISILSKFEKNPNDCYYYDISADQGNIPGVIARGSHPRVDSQSKLRARINEVIQEAGRASGEAQQALIERGYSLLRSWCEVVVEQDFLSGVTQRYQPNVMMTKLRDIRIDRLKNAIDGVLPVFEKACRMTEAHSQPLEMLNTRPTVAELQEDWKTVQQARDAYIKA